MDSLTALLTAFLTGLFIGAVIGAVGVGIRAAQVTEHHADIIAHHAAHYGGVTGKFTWNDEVTK